MISQLQWAWMWGLTLSYTGVSSPNNILKEITSIYTSFSSTRKFHRSRESPGRFMKAIDLQTRVLPMPNVSWALACHDRHRDYPHSSKKKKKRLHSRAILLKKRSLNYRLLASRASAISWLNYVFLLQNWSIAVSKDFPCTSTRTSSKSSNYVFVFNRILDLSHTCAMRSLNTWYGKAFRLVRIPTSSHPFRPIRQTLLISHLRTVDRIRWCARCEPNAFYPTKLVDLRWCEAKVCDFHLIYHETVATAVERCTVCAAYWQRHTNPMHMNF